MKLNENERERNENKREMNENELEMNELPNVYLSVIYFSVHIFIFYRIKLNN